MLLIIILAGATPFTCQPSASAQAGSVVNVPLTFHGYSIVLRDANGSFCVYDGADGAAADQVSATQVNLDSQISGQRQGYNYWSAVIMWATKLPMDLHVQGSVNVHAYISSTFKLSGLFSGGGYAMGIVDIDENNNEVKEFITEAPYTIGGNPFTATPTQYSLSTNVDYVFKKGHAIGFAVGLGATTQGFTATVYFGSQDRNSGATLPVAETMQTQTLSVDGKTVSVTSNSAIENLQYDQTAKALSFLAQGISYTTGACSVSIPKTLMGTPFTVAQGSQSITATVNEDASNYQISFSHTRDAQTIRVVGSAPTQTTNPTQTQTNSPTQTGGSSSPSHGTDAPTASPSVPEYNAVMLLVFVFLFIVVGVVVALLSKRRN